MGVLYANTVNETQKLFLKKRTIFFLIITTIIPIVAAVIVSVFQNNIGINPITANQFPVFVLGIFTNIVLPLLITMAVVDMFSAEFGDRTLKITLLRPITRFKVFTSKVISIGIYIIINLGIAFIISNIAILFLKGNSGFLHQFFKSVMAYGVSMIPMLAMGIAVVFIAQFFKSSSGALTISILIYIAVSIVSRLFPAFFRMSLTSYTDWYQLWIGNSILLGKAFIAFIVILSYCMIFFAGGFYLFDKREL